MVITQHWTHKTIIRCFDSEELKARILNDGGGGGSLNDNTSFIYLQIIKDQLMAQGPWKETTIFMVTIKILCGRINRGEIYTMDENLSSLVPYQPIHCCRVL
jgi:hypothetical protein